MDPKNLIHKYMYAENYDEDDIFVPLKLCNTKVFIPQWI